jgi:hypothetical protein
VFEEVVVPCHGRRLEQEVLPALSRAFFAKDLEPLAAFVRGLRAEDPAVKAAVEKDWQEVKADVLHGQIDYGGKGPLPEHWKQYIDQDANLYDWRHPKWAKDGERLLVDATIRTVRVEGWDGRAHPEPRTTAGFVDLMMELGEALPEAKPFTDKFLEGLPEWLQHDNAYTGGYLTESDAGALLALLRPRQDELKGRLKAGPVVGSLVDVLERAQAAGVGLSWTVPGMTR